MKDLMQKEHSICCDAPVKINTNEQPYGVIEVFWFVCSKCKKLCHLMKG